MVNVFVNVLVGEFVFVGVFVFVKVFVLVLVNVLVDAGGTVFVFVGV